MKNSLIKFYAVAFYFSATFMMMAQGSPGTGSDNGGIDDNGSGDVTPSAPIDDYVWVLLCLVILYIFLKYRSTLNGVNIKYIAKNNKFYHVTTIKKMIK